MTDKLFELYVTDEQQRLCLLRHSHDGAVTFFTEEDVAEMVKILRGGVDGSEIIRAATSTS